MTHKNIYLVILLFYLFSAWTVCAEGNFLSSTSEEPIEITSDRMEAFNEKKLVIFSGNATVVQGTSVLKSDRLLLYYTKHQAQNKNVVGTETDDRAGDLEKIEARGNVSLVQGDRVATGDEAVYYRDQSKIIMTGNARLNEGKNSIRGERVIVFLDENRGVVESSSDNKVKAIIYPKERRGNGAVNP